MLIATGLVLRLATGVGSLARFRVTAFAYGVALGACGLGKAPAGALMLVFHAAFFALANRDWRLRRIVELSSLILAGVALNIVMLQWADPSWLSALREGVALTNIVGHGGLSELVRGMMQEVRLQAPALLELSMFAALIIILARNIRHNRRAQISIAVVALICACALELARSQDRHLWFPTVALSALILWSFETHWRRPSQWTRAGAVDLAMTCLLLLLPLAFSFGTNLLVFEHSQMAAVFGITALLIRLQRLADRRQITRLALGASLTLLCVPTLIIQLQNTFDRAPCLSPADRADRPNRAGTRRAREHSTIAGHDHAGCTRRDQCGGECRWIHACTAGSGFDGRRPRLDLCARGAPTRRGLAIRRLFRQRGRRDSTDISPSARALQHAWLLTSSTNPRRIVGWQRMLDGRLGAGAHEQVGTVPMRSPYVWHGNAPDSTNVDLWRPRVVGAAADSRSR